MFIPARSVKNKLNTAFYLVLMGLIIHDVPEGFAVANSFLLATGLRAIVAISIAFHNIPEEYIIASAGVACGKKMGNIVQAAILSALAEPVGVIAGLVVYSIVAGWLPLMTAFAAGLMVFVSWHELIPLDGRYNNKLLFTLGAMTAIAVYTILNFFLPE